jgi:hypothetical protein
MTYAAVETALATVIKGATGFSTANVTSGDPRPFGTGQTKIVILEPGAFDIPSPAGSSRRKATTWGILVNLYIAFQDDIAEIASDIRTVRQTLIDRIDKFPTLDGQAGVTHAYIVRGREPDEWVLGTRRWWRQVLEVQATETTTVTFAE